MALDHYDLPAVPQLDGRKERQRTRRLENDLRFKLAREERVLRLRLVPATQIPCRP